MKRTRLAAALCALALLATACSRSDNTTTASSSSSSGASSSSSSGDATLLANGGFGDLASVCAKADSSGNTASDTGVTPTEMHIGSVTDKGAEARPELDREMYDVTVAFAKWCNEKGGINGRNIVVEDRDAKLFEYPARVAESCQADLALVGGGAAIDDDAGAREACGLPNFPGYVVDPKARQAGLRVSALPNPVGTLMVGQYKALETVQPGGMAAYGNLYAPLPAVQIVSDTEVAAVKQLGGNVVYVNQYNVLGESNWEPFVQDIKSKGVKLFEFVGEPVNLGLLQDQMAVDNYWPAATVLTTNFYDSKYIQEHGKNAKNTWIETAFYPLEQASDNKATQDYLDLMKQYNPSGKIAILGEQALSALLIFAQSAKECGANLTRTCIVDKGRAITDWTGGGLHAKTDPSTDTPTNCFALVKVEPDKFVYDKTTTVPNNGIYNCDSSNLLKVG